MYIKRDSYHLNINTDLDKFQCLYLRIVVCNIQTVKQLTSSYSKMTEFIHKFMYKKWPEVLERCFYTLITFV